MQIQLKTPIEVDGKKIESVTLGPLRGKHMRAMERAEAEGEAAITLAMIAGVTGLSDAEVDELTIGDIEAISEAAADFLPASTDGT